ncbi:metallophosphoesterase [Desulfovibrio sp. OttesenSCG-928-F07]|nr:metallophosphoesterase [Desulfovibrio sp. OttesenSCG-928-F07]
MLDYATYLTAASVVFTCFLFWRLYRWQGAKLWLIPIFVLGTILAFGLPLYQVTEQYPALHDIIALCGQLWLAAVCFNFIIFLGLELLRAMVWLYYRWLDGEGFDFLPPRRGVPLSLVLLLLLLGAGALEAQYIQVTNLGIQTQKLPRGINAVRIAFVSDLHLGRFTGERTVQRLANIINEQNADLLIFGGDIVSGNMSGRQRESYLLSTAMPRYGSLGVLGDHEAMNDHRKNALPFLERSWVHIMRGEALAAAGISVVGVDDPQVAKVQGSTVHNPMLILERMPKERFTLLVKHQPDIQPDSVGFFDLQLSGHTRGGQIWPLKYFMEYLYGQKQGRLVQVEGENGTGLYYSTTGVGFWRLPLRLFTRPEVVVIDLVR